MNYSSFTFSKYEGTGNDFILIDDRRGEFPIVKEQIVRKCHRQFGIGADGLILLQPSKKADFCMRIFNADGTEAEMCGNGLRCLVHFLKKLHITGDTFQIETLDRVYGCTIEKEKVSIRMGKPQWFEENGVLSLGDERIEYSWLHMGVPHLIVFVEDLLVDDFHEKGKLLRNHPHFAPFGVNVTFAKVESSTLIRIRTFERGVEKETLACGTGASAVCAAAWKKGVIDTNVIIEFLSKEQLQFSLNNNEIYMKGPVRNVFDGSFIWNSEEV